MSTPTTAELADQIVAKFEAQFGQDIPLFAKAVLRVVAKVFAAPLALVYKYVGFMLLQQYVGTATMRETEVLGEIRRPLVDQGRQFGVDDPDEGSRTELVIEVTVLEQTGSLAAGQQCIRSDTGVVYAVVAPVALDAPTVQVTIRAVSDPNGGGGVGEIGMLEVGDTVEFANAPAQIEPEASVLSVAVVGEDPEEQEDYRQRVLQHTQFKPQGGAFADYREWGEKVPGVKAIYPYKSETEPGVVDIFVEATAVFDPDGIPDQTLLDAVKAAIELDEDGLANNRPANDLVRVFPITRTAFEVELSGLESGGTEEDVQEEIDEGLDEYLRAAEPYIVGLSMLPRRDHITLGGVGGAAHEIASANGATFQSVTLRLGGESKTAYRLLPGQLAKLDTES